MNNTSLLLTISKSIAAKSEKVWEALTEPTIIKQYFFGTNVESDWKEGASLVFRGEWEGKVYEDKGTILKLIPNRLLQYNYWSSFSTKPDRPENYANIWYELSEKGNETTLVIKQDSFETEEDLKKSEGHWEYVLEELKKIVEKN